MDFTDAYHHIVSARRVSRSRRDKIYCEKINMYVLLKQRR